MTEYDSELGKISDRDREYARDLLEDDLPEAGDPHTRLELVASWFRKVRYEAVMADRRTRGEQAQPERPGPPYDLAYEQNRRR